MVRACRAWAVLAAMAALVVLALPGSAAAAPAASERVDEGRASILEYWTPERMLAARPASELLEGIELGDGILGLGGTSAQPASTPIADPSAGPARKHGKVFFTLGGNDYACSGTVVRSFTRQLVTTAGHCLHGSGRFASNFMFVPAYDQGAAPYGEWTARKLATTQRWASSEDLRYDVGMATMRKRGEKKIQNVVGARGIRFNQERNQFFQAYGYPAAILSLDQAQRCDSQYQGRDNRFGSPAPNRIQCDMKGGASGGGWIIGSRFVNSVASYFYECSIEDIPVPCEHSEEGKLYGPYFGNVIQDLYISQRGKRRR